MTLAKRRIILAITTFFFIALSMVLVFYAMGYKVSPNLNEIREVGIIDISNSPKDADIFINDELVESSSPHQEKDVLPGTYTVKTQIEGHTDWEKKITVHPRKVTWIRNARNFFQNPKPQKLFENEIVHISQSKNHETLFFTSINELKLELYSLDLNDTEPVLLATFNPDVQKITSIESSFDGKNVLIGLIEENNQKWATLSNSSNEEIQFLPLDKRNIKELSFSERNSNELYFIENNTLFELKINSGTITRISSEEINVLTYKCNSNSILIISQNEKSILSASLVNISPLRIIGDEIESLGTLPIQDVSGVELNDFNDFAINSTEKGIVLYNYENKELVELNSGAEQFAFAKKTRKLFFRNTNEIYFYEMATDNEAILRQAYQPNNTNLLTRYSKPITQASWLVDEAWIISQFENETKIVELDERDRRNTYTLAVSAQKIYQNPKGNALFFLNDMSQLELMRINEEPSILPF